MTSLDPADVFRQEASELFEALEGALLDLTLRPDDRELVDTAFRALHTIKGSGAMFGFDKVAAFTHEFETAFDLVRKGEVKPTGDLISVALAAKDFIRALIEAPESTDAIIGDAILADLQRFVGKESPAAAVTADPEPATTETRSAGWRLHLEFASHILCNGSNPLDLLDDLQKLGPCFAIALTDGVPLLDDLEPELCFLKWDVTLHSDCDRSAIDDVFMFVQDEMTLTLAPLLEEEAAAPRARPPQEAVNFSAQDKLAVAEQATTRPPSSAKREETRRSDDRSIPTVRVQAERLDELMDRVGELVIAQARLTQLAAAGDDLSIKIIAEEIERLAASLRDTTMGARMVPIGSVCGRFRRLVHDLAQVLG
jgi:two-component system chemotaxis sensor kinase CheA